MTFLKPPSVFAYIFFSFYYINAVALPCPACNQERCTCQSYSYQMQYPSQLSPDNAKEELDRLARVAHQFNNYQVWSGVINTALRYANVYSYPYNKEILIHLGTAIISIALVYQRMGDLEMCRRSLRDGLEVLQKVMSHIKQDKNQKELLQEAITEAGLDNNLQSIYRSQAVAYYLLEEFSESINLFRKADGNDASSIPDGDRLTIQESVKYIKVNMDKYPFLDVRSIDAWLNQS